MILLEIVDTRAVQYTDEESKPINAIHSLVAADYPGMCIFKQQIPGNYGHH